MAKIETFKQLLVHELAALMSVEEQLLEVLPKLAKVASSAKLQKALLDHLEETQKQLQRLEKAAEVLEMKKSDRKLCKAMKGLLAEGQETVESIPPGPLRDAAIIAACQRVEHYEMAAYGTARAFAEQLEETDVSRLISETFKEELAADQLLTRLAEAEVNSQAQNV
ncbi:MAG: DUF892 family protein [Candidatus Eremiobacteraeota bacterium]|nr:DUF892 family protein [Candidatus Eremiobacteraeota bacterium]MCW5869866.1 DUF892 family protein [Candidatus Eremiobacteraeota bacterium]